MFLRIEDFNECLMLGLVWCDAKSEEGLPPLAGTSIRPCHEEKTAEGQFPSPGRAGTELYEGNPWTLTEIIMLYKNAIWIFCLPHIDSDWLTNILTNRMRKICIIILCLLRTIQVICKFWFGFWYNFAFIGSSFYISQDVAQQQKCHRSYSHPSSGKVCPKGDKISYLKKSFPF